MQEERQNWERYLMGLTEVLYRVCDLTQAAAGLETVLASCFLSETCSQREPGLLHEG